METVILVKYTSHLIYELVSTLPIRNGNAAPVAFFFTTPAYDGDVVSTLPIRNGNSTPFLKSCKSSLSRSEYLTYKEWKHHIITHF